MVSAWAKRELTVWFAQPSWRPTAPLLKVTDPATQATLDTINMVDSLSQQTRESTAVVDPFIKTFTGAAGFRVGTIQGGALGGIAGSFTPLGPLGGLVGGAGEAQNERGTQRGFTVIEGGRAGGEPTAEGVKKGSDHRVAARVARLAAA